ncbi:hypothetical protein [Fictibacillus phosphorivorans]|uniref:hypothetical protein n=1 Tax=Fictibacillus phosphorivorans TaxID=1221500 RepID=UPI000ACAD557|nr:hypothetical protein [Fictibacillus phosphorivorans]
MTIERGDLVSYHDELHKVLHVYSSDFLEIRKVNEPYVPRVILVHKSEVTVQL